LVRSEFDRIKRTIGEIPIAIERLYSALGKDDLVALLTYSLLPEEWIEGRDERMYARKAAEHVDKGGFSLFVVPSDKLRKRCPLLDLQSPATDAWFESFDAFVQRVKKVSTGDGDPAKQIAFATTEIPLFLAPGHKYILFMHKDDAYAMGYFPCGPGSSSPYEPSYTARLFLPLTGEIVDALFQIMKKAVKTQLDEASAEQREALQAVLDRLECPRGD